MLLALVTITTLAAPRTDFERATPESVGLKTADMERVTTAVRSWVDAGEVVGAEFLILKDRKVVLHATAGWMDREDRVPMQKGSIFCVRSMTKPVIGTAVQMLVDEGKLALDDKASRYLPSFDNDRSREITIEQMLTHRSGFPITLVDKPLAEYADHRAIVDQAGEIGPGGTPGRAFEYSDTNFEVLTEIVSVVSKRSAEEFVRERILRPIGMDDTYCVLRKDGPDRKRVSSNYVGETGRFEKYWDNEQPPMFPFLSGAAGMYSTCEDYARFVAVWLDHGAVGGRRIVSKSAVERAVRPIVAMKMIASEQPCPTAFDGFQVKYGQAWMVWERRDARPAGALPIFGHGGSDGTFAWCVPEQDLIALYFSQSRNGLTCYRFEELVASIAGIPTRPATADPVRALDADELAPLVGGYASGEIGMYVFTRVADGRLVADFVGQASTPLGWPDAEGRWPLPAPSKTALSFARDEHGAVERLDLHEAGKTYAFTRLRSEPDYPTVDQLMRMRRDKLGGAALDALKSLRLRGTLEAKGQKGTVLVNVASRAQWSSSTSLGKNEQTIVLTGGKVWSLVPKKPREEITGVYADQVVFANPLFRLDDWREHYEEVEVVHRLEFGERPCWIVRCRARSQPTTIRWVDVETGMLLEEQGWVAVKGLPTSALTLDFEDYAPFAGVMLPRRIERESAAGGHMTISYESIEPNVEIPPATFDTETRGGG